MNWFSRTFGVGRLPRADAAAYEAEGVVLLEEALGGVITLRNFRSPWRRAGWKRQWFLGSVVITRKRFVAYQYAGPILDLQLESPTLRAITMQLTGFDRLTLTYEAGDLNPDQSGAVELRYRTPRAADILDHLRRAGPED